MVRAIVARGTDTIRLVVPAGKARSWFPRNVHGAHGRGLCEAAGHGFVTLPVLRWLQFPHLKLTNDTWPPHLEASSQALNGLRRPSDQSYLLRLWWHGAQH